MKHQLWKCCAPHTSETTNTYFNSIVDFSKHQRTSPEERSKEGSVRGARCRAEVFQFQNDDVIIAWWKMPRGRGKHTVRSFSGRQFSQRLGELIVSGVPAGHGDHEECESNPTDVGMTSVRYVFVYVSHDVSIELARAAAGTRWRADYNNLFHFLC